MPKRASRVKRADEAVEPDAIEAPGIETGENGSLAMLVNGGLDRSITLANGLRDAQDNCTLLAKRVVEKIRSYGDFPVDDLDSYRDAKAVRADIRAAKKVIDGRRRAFELEYTKDLDALKAAIKQATNPMDEADRELKEKIDAYERLVAQHRRDVLEEAYEDFMGGLAEIVPFDRFIQIRGEKGARGDLVWLRRATDEYAALEAQESVMKAVASEWNDLVDQAQTPEEADQLRDVYAQTLDFGAAVREFTQRRRREEELRKRREEADAWERAQEPTATGEQGREPDPAPSDGGAELGCGTWRVIVDCEVRTSAEGARNIGRQLRELGLTGHITKEE